MTPNEAQRAVLRALAREIEWLPALDLLHRDRKLYDERELGEYRTSRQVGVRLGQLTRMGLAERRLLYGIGQYRITPAGRELLGLPPRCTGCHTEELHGGRVIDSAHQCGMVREPEPPRRLKIAHRYQLDGTTLVVAVNERGQVGIGRAELNEADETYEPVSPAELQQLIEQAIVDSVRIKNRLHPPERSFTSRVLAELNPQQGVTTSDVAGRANLTLNEAYSELLRLQGEGRVRRESRLGERSVWLPAGGRLEWHEGTHPWDTHDGYRRHQHSLNGALTIAPDDKRVHFAGGLPFDH